MNYYISKSGSVEGPMTEPQLRELLNNQEIGVTTPCCPEGQTLWSTVGAVLGQVPPPPPPPPAPSAASTAAPLSLLALISLISGVVLLIPALNFWALTPCLLVPVILGHLACASIKKSPVRIKGIGLAYAGLLAGYAGIAVVGVAAIKGATRSSRVQERIETDSRNERAKEQAEVVREQIQKVLAMAEAQKSAQAGTSVRKTESVGVSVADQSRINAECDRTKFNLKVLAQYLDEFRKDVGRYPTTQEGLQAFRVCKAKGWRGPYLNQDYLIDVWSRSYEYKFPGIRHPESYDLRSAGPDGVMGSADDITN